MTTGRLAAHVAAVLRKDFVRKASPQCFWSKRCAPRKWMLLATSAFLIFGSSVWVSAQNGPDNDPDGVRGYVDNVFHHSSVDSINLYNGLLTIPIALGPAYPVGPKLKLQLMMTYSSRDFDFGHPLAAGDFTHQPMSWDPALGDGWSFTLGAIKDCASGWCYIASRKIWGQSCQMGKIWGQSCQMVSSAPWRVRSELRWLAGSTTLSFEETSERRSSATTAIGSGI